jgi:ATP-binding cassette subfamily B multidrug efflux pump
MALLWSLFKQRFMRHPRALSLGFVAVVLAGYIDVQITLTIGDGINQLSAASGLDDISFVWSVVGLIVLFALAHSIVRFFQRWLIVVVSRRVEVGLKQDLFDRLVSLPFSFHNKSRSGDVVSRLTSDVENLRMFLGPGMMYCTGALVMVPVSLYELWLIDPVLSSSMVLPMLGMGLAMKAFSPRLHKFSTAVQESLADISHKAQENFAGIRVVKGYCREDEQAARFTDTSETNRANQVELGRARGMTHAAVHGASDITFAVILVIAGLALIGGDMQRGDLFKFIDLTTKVFWPLIALGWIAGMYPRAVASARRVDELLSERSDIVDPVSPQALDDPQGALDFQSVDFTYAGSELPTLHAITASVPAGTTLGVVGPTGSGKSTLLNLIGRLFDCEGQILLDGHPIRELRLADLRRTLGYVPQDSFLFSEPYADNIRFGADGNLGDDEIRELIERAAMTAEVEDFEDGLQQLIGERGVTLSGGQRQRTCIARALARNPVILILDDCLSAVDTETESELLGNLREAGHGRTVVVSAHRLSTVRSADQILVLSADGHVEAIGTHAELTRRAGWYQRTWQQQQKLEEAGEL